ncbi:triphosphoribosyl-dephospho-CoA synthase [Pedobacter sp. L105]|uniref:triphosphoribosyl-dephospho-CoA synthase n=1 Tax=Pedobacter sp. L105 TaxID=1641871 RepID=UPI00131E99B8|nr:triphosphoribosyl-dephospho-CoA synthase [Pedobacter sp. L105]
MLILQSINPATKIAKQLARFAVEALLEEVRLSPKPGLVDSYNNGCHHDLTLELMEKSAISLYITFYEMAIASIEKEPSQYLREQLAAIGRYGEQKMLEVTGQVNTHKGAIWTLGLLTGAAGMLLSHKTAKNVTLNALLSAAGAIAGFEDRFMPVHQTNGTKVRKRYPVRSAREEAIACFPALQQIAFPAWKKYNDEPEDIRTLNVLLALMAVTDDTCILNRSDMDVLHEMQHRAQDILNKGGLGLIANQEAYLLLDGYITTHWISPGGSADLLAATIFLQKILHHKI